MAIKYGGSGVYKNLLYLLSTDALLDEDNQNTGIDLLRRIFGAFYYYGTLADSDQVVINRTGYAWEGVTNLADTGIYLVAPHKCPQIQYAEVNPTRIQFIDENVDIPNLKLPIRLYADKDSHAVKGDFHWKQFLFGGKYAGEELPKRLNSEKIFYDATFAFPKATDYREQQAYKSLNVDLPTYYASCNIFSNYYDYNENVQKYQDWSSGLQSELLMPNFYVVSEQFRKDLTETAIADGLPGYSALSDKEAAIQSQLAYIENKNKITQYHFPVGNYWKDLEQDEYFGSYFTETGENFQLQQEVLNGLQNILFDEHYFRYVRYDLRSSSDSEPYIEHSLDRKLSTFFNIQIKFDRHTNTIISRGNANLDRYDNYWYDEHDVMDLDSTPSRQRQTVKKLIRDSNFSSRMLEILKDIDNGDITEIPKKRLPFNYCLTKQSFSSTNDGALHNGSIVEAPDTPVGLTSINFMDFLAYTYNNYNVALNDNYIFAGPSHAEQVATMADDTFGRTFNGASLINLIDGVKDLMKSYMRDLTPGADMAWASEDIRMYTWDVLTNLYGPNFKKQEVLAYKIEKMPATSSGDSSEQEVIQKFWVFNSDKAPAEISIYDSQVKYGEEYTYKITAYTLVLSHKYKYGDFRLTKQIGAADYLGDVDGVEYCLQFYNPETNMVAPQLLGKSDFTADEHPHLRSMISGFNAFAPNSVELSRHPQLLDFHLYIEPCMELIEVPMFQKTIKVMDNPCNSINVVPFHFIDNSNRVGFQVNQESFIKRPYPEIINEHDLKNKMDYLRTKEIEPYNLVELISESPARYIEMYRIKNKPNSFADFDDALVATIDLRINNSVYNSKNKMISDQITPNTVYYYVFRFVNENGMHGPLSQIIQCELVNDGGYSYALFDTVDTSEFNPNQITKTSKAFKKLMQIVPNINQLYFNDQGVNYEDYAQNQIDNLQVGLSETGLWNKKFKIRLTSKKTSKKLDLNVSYDTIERNLSKTKDTVPPPIDYEAPGILTDSSLEEEPLSIVLDSGIGDDSPISTKYFGRFSLADYSGLGIVDIDATPALPPVIEIEPIPAAVEGPPAGPASPTASPTSGGSEVIPDGLVTRTSELLDEGGYITTEGIGFPITVYRCITGSTKDMEEEPLFGAGTKYYFAGVTTSALEWLKTFLYTQYRDGDYELTTASFTPSVSLNKIAKSMCDEIYKRRSHSKLIVPMDRKLALVSTLFLVNLMPIAHAGLTGPTGGRGIDLAIERYTNNGRGFIELRDHIINYFKTDSRFSIDSNYEKFDDSPYRPEGFNMDTLLENLHLDSSVIRGL